jgi:hypothetical protein
VGGSMQWPQFTQKSEPSTSEVFPLGQEKVPLVIIVLGWHFLTSLLF